MEGAMPSRVSSEEATSRGLRIGDTTRTSAPNFSISSLQNSNKRQIRGSFRRKRRLSPNSSSSSICARSRNFPATGDLYQPASNARQSSHLDPADFKISLFRSVITEDSQNPLSFPGPASLPMTFFGKSQPTKLRIRATADVPLRCMPATRMATFVGRPPAASTSRDVSTIGICAASFIQDRPMKSIRLWTLQMIRAPLSMKSSN